METGSCPDHWNQERGRRDLPGRSMYCEESTVGRDATEGLSKVKGLDGTPVKEKVWG